MERFLMFTRTVAVPFWPDAAVVTNTPLSATGVPGTFCAS
jgi:hypothetical protein